MPRGTALIILALASSVTICLRAQSPPPTVTTGQASVAIKGHALNGSFTYNTVGGLTMWGAGGGFIDLQSEREDAFQYSPIARPGKYKTTVARPLVVQVGAGPTMKVVASAGGECTITLTRADDTGVAGSFECGRVTVLGPEKKILGAIDSMTGSFGANR
jgi:hypothetical protein